MAIQTAEAEAHDIEAMIADAAVATEALARQIFGPAAYVRRDVHEDRETGDEDIVFRVHYCFPEPDNDFDRLAELHEAFMSAWVRAMSREICGRVILSPIPCEIDNPYDSSEGSEIAIHAAKAHELDRQIDEAAVATEALMRQIFGEAAYLVRGTHVERETGEERVAFELHYCFDDPEGDFDRLAALNEAFMRAYVRAIPPDILWRIILEPIPTDAD